MVKIIIGVILMIMALLNKEDLRHKIGDIFISMSSGLGVYLSVPQIVENFYFQEIAKSLISIFTASVILIISFPIRNYYEKKFKEKK